MRGRLILMLLPAVLAAPALGASVVWAGALENPTGVFTGGAGGMADGAVVVVPEPPPLVLIAAGMTFILRRGTRKPLDPPRRGRGG